MPHLQDVLVVCTVSKLNSFTPKKSKEPHLRLYARARARAFVAQTGRSRNSGSAPAARCRVPPRANCPSRLTGVEVQHHAHRTPPCHTLGLRAKSVYTFALAAIFSPRDTTSAGSSSPPAASRSG